MVGACILRIFLLYVNMQRHPAFFTPSPAAMHHHLSADDKPYMNPFGYEISNIAYSIVCKHEGFSSPFGGSTGPTGWVSPGIVLLYVLSFALFGCFTKGSILFMFGLSIGLSLLIIVLIYASSRLLWPHTSTGFIAAVLYACCPQEIMSILYPHQTDFNVYMFWFIITAYLFLRLITSCTARDLCLFALAAGASLLFTPAMLLPIVACLAAYAVRSRKKLPMMIRHLFVCTVVIVVVVAPYIMYQKSRMGHWFFIKSNGPFEIALGNSPEFNGVLIYDLFQKHHPGSNKDEYKAYCEMGEIAYIKNRYARFFEHFDVQGFSQLTAKRFLFFFFILQPYIPLERFHTPRLVAEYIGYAIPGLTLLIYLFMRYRNMRWQDYFIYCYIISYALPYLFAGIMYRYAYPISTLTTLLLAALVSTLRSAKRTYAAA